MKFLKKLLDTTTKKIVAIALLALFLVWIILFFTARSTAIGLIKPILWTLLIVAVAWLAIHFGIKAWRKRKRKEFDEAVAAKEGIEDRRKEWSNWTAELEKQGIDRYELPFYLLVGEPQSGKSVLLHNSDLHFPFGQDRLSGVGGTRGCDWWFTDEAVVLDLAGRLFTHEGGAADRLEFEAFLQLLYEFRPLCPANGVILVIPCDSLLSDTEEEVAAKATKIQNALLTLTTKLQAQLPVYLVMTKGDHIFGFAEAVHRLDVEHRHQMFGWSRPADTIEQPFDLVEATQAFHGVVQRARLLRGHMMAGARIPEALPEVDRLYAFPHELEGMQQNLEAYLKRIFTASNLTDRVFFRGVYLTSGLQSGVPIAKVCTDLFGQPGEADTRDLEALFQKQRAYFIKDLIRNRIFGERGLVRPTEGRVEQTRRSSVVGYGVATAIVLLSIVFAIVYLAQGTETYALETYETALEETERAVKDRDLAVPDLLYRLQLIADAVDLERGAYEKAYTDSRDDFKELYAALFDALLVPALKNGALDNLERMLGRELQSHDELHQVCSAVVAAVDGLGIDFSDSEVREDVLAVVPPYESAIRTVEGEEPLTLKEAFDRRDEYGDDEGLLAKMNTSDRARLVPIVNMAVVELHGCLKPGAPTQPKAEPGYVLAWRGAQKAHEDLLSNRLETSGRALETVRTYARSMAKLEEIEKTLKGSGTGRSIELKDVALPIYWLGSDYRPPMVAFLQEQGITSFPATWPELDDLLIFANKQFEGHEGAFNLSSLGLHFGSEDFGQTMFQQSEGLVGRLQGKFIVGDGGDYNPLKELDEPVRLLDLCRHQLPLSFQDGGLTGLGKEVKQIDTTTLAKASPQVVGVFLAELVELSQLFKRQVENHFLARRALGAEAEADEARPLSIRLVNELVELHEALGNLIVGRDLAAYPRQYLVEWQGQVESLLEKHLDASGPAARWVPEPASEGALSAEGWTLLESLGRASKLAAVNPQQNPVADTAAYVQREALVEMGQHLVDRWQARAADDLRQTVKIAQELGALARGVKNRLGAPPSLSGVEFQAWSRQVDTLMSRRLAGVTEKVDAIWRAKISDASLPTLVTGALGELRTIQEKIDASTRGGLDSLTPILDELREEGDVLAWLELPDTGAILADLRQWRIPTRVSAVEGHEEYGLLRAALERLSRANTNDGPFLASEYAGRFLVRPAEPGPAANAGIRLVREIEQRLAAKLRSEIRRSYAKDLESLLTSTSHDEFFEALYWTPGDDASRLRDTEVRDSLDKLLKKRGELEGLLKRYSMAEGEPLQGVVFPPDPEPDEDEWAALHRFLLDLQAFLLAGDEKGKSVLTSAFDFRIEPRTGDAGSVWSAQSIPPDEWRDWFWYPGDDSAVELQKEAILPNMGRLRVARWGFEASRDDRSILFLWSKKVERNQALGDPDAYRYEVPTCLAPMLLAWTGEPLDDELLEYEVRFSPQNTNRAAPMRLIFERALPERPPQP